MAVWSDRNMGSDQMPPETDQPSDAIKPWTIKGIPPEARNAAIAAAERADQNIGEWIARAIFTAIKADRQADRTPVPIENAQVRPSAPQVDMDTIERLTEAARKLAEAAGEPVPKSVSRMLYARMREQGRAPRLTKGQTAPAPE